MTLFLYALMVTLAKLSLFLACGVLLAAAEQMVELFRSGRPVTTLWPDGEEETPIE